MRKNLLTIGSIMIATAFTLLLTASLTGCDKKGNNGDGEIPSVENYLGSYTVSGKIFNAEEDLRENITYEDVMYLYDGTDNELLFKNFLDDGWHWDFEYKNGILINMSDIYSREYNSQTLKYSLYAGCLYEKDEESFIEFILGDADGKDNLKAEFDMQTNILKLPATYNDAPGPDKIIYYSIWAYEEIGDDITNFHRVTDYMYNITATKKVSGKSMGAESANSNDVKFPVKFNNYGIVSAPAK